MSDVERNLFNQMITHHIKSFAESASQDTRDYHLEMYRTAKHILWDYQEEKRNNDKGS
jgi:hypothetical protein